MKPAPSPSRGVSKGRICLLLSQLQLNYILHLEVY